MILPRILIIDDQYARDDDERSILKRNAGLKEILPDTSDEELSRLAKNDIIASAVFCSGQKITANKVENKYDIIKEAVAKGWGKGSASQWNLVLLDVRFDSGRLNKSGLPSGQAGDDNFGETVRDRLNHDFSGLPLVMFSSKGEVDIEDTATPYLSKEELGKSEFKKCLLEYGILNIEQSRRLLELGEDVVVSSPAMIDVYRKAYSYATSNEPVLILGESGVGKEKIAQYIHRMSSRNSGPFVAINVAAIPSELLESELFGIEERAATGVGRRIGRFEQANGGTLFFDEIGDMPLSFQVKILRALQERVIERVGGRTPIPVDIRLLSATSRDIPQKIANREFREDLLHRLGTLPITVPPLRDHPEDIIPLAESFLARHSRQQNKKGISLSKEAKREIEKYPFDNNNVRELENLIKRIVSTTGNNRVISGKDIVSALKQGFSTSPTQSPHEAAKAENKGINETTVTLQALADILNTLSIDKDDPALLGAKTRLEGAFQELMKRLAGASLERCMDPLKKEFNRQSAMRLLTGDESLKGKGPGRVLNEILGRKQENEIKDEELEKLVTEWKASLK